MFNFSPFDDSHRKQLQNFRKTLQPKSFTLTEDYELQIWRLQTLIFILLTDDRPTSLTRTYELIIPQDKRHPKDPRQTIILTLLLESKRDNWHIWTQMEKIILHVKKHREKSNENRLCIENARWHESRPCPKVPGLSDTYMSWGELKEIYLKVNDAEERDAGNGKSVEKSSARAAHHASAGRSTNGVSFKEQRASGRASRSSGRH